jgi:DNA-binding beta-propeller fold protein YncE
MGAGRIQSFVAVAAAFACAHARADTSAGPPLDVVAPPGVEAGVVWPRPPAAPRARRVGAATLARGAIRASWWKKALRWVAGVRPEEVDADVLVRPFDVAVRPDGSFVLADPDRPGVLDYARDGTFVADLTCANHPWASPMSVAVSEDGAVWVADAAVAAVVRWTAQGCRVLRPEGLERPTGIAIAGGRIAVADPPAHRVVVLSPDGTILGSFGRRGGGDSEFNFPSDVAAAPDGSLYVVDALNFRVVHLAADGRWLGAFGSPGERGSGLARPKGVHVDAAGRVYVTDAQRDLALVFRPDGILEYLLGEPGAEPGQLAHPAGISTRGDRLVVADSVNRRAEIYELLGGHR